MDDGWKSSALVGVEEIACGLFTALATAKLSSRCTKYDENEEDDDDKFSSILNVEQNVQHILLHKVCHVCWI